MNEILLWKGTVMAQKKSNQKASAKTKSKTSSKNAKIDEVQLKQKKQREIAAIVLLVFGVVAFLLAAIPGESGWTSIHNFVLGVAGFCAFVIPILLIYLAVILSMDKFSNNITAKCVEVVLLLLFLSATIFMFKSYDGSSFSAFSDFIIKEYNAADGLGSGVIGTLLGFPIGAALDPTGGKIITIVATITDLMIITGTTVSKLTASAQRVQKKPRVIWKT